MGKSKKRNNRLGSASQATPKPAEPVRQESDGGESISDVEEADGPRDAESAALAVIEAPVAGAGATVPKSTDVTRPAVGVDAQDVSISNGAHVGAGELDEDTNESPGEVTPCTETGTGSSQLSAPASTETVESTAGQAGHTEPSLAEPQDVPAAPDVLSLDSAHGEQVDMDDLQSADEVLEYDQAARLDAVAPEQGEFQIEEAVEADIAEGEGGVSREELPVLRSEGGPPDSAGEAVDDFTALIDSDVSAPRSPSPTPAAEAPPPPALSLADLIATDASDTGPTDAFTDLAYTVEEADDSAAITTGHDLREADEECATGELNDNVAEPSVTGDAKDEATQAEAKDDDFFAELANVDAPRAEDEQGGEKQDDFDAIARDLGADDQSAPKLGDQLDVAEDDSAKIVSESSPAGLAQSSGEAPEDDFTALATQADAPDEVPAFVSQLDGENDDFDVLLAASDPAATAQAAAQPVQPRFDGDDDREDDFSALLAASTPAEATGSDAVAETSQSIHDKYADLFDDFEELDAPGPAADMQPELPEPTGATSMFDDDSSDFDKILESAQDEIRLMAAQHPEPIASTASASRQGQATSVDQLFAGDADGDGDISAWLNDTTIDDSFLPDEQLNTSSTAAWTTTTGSTDTAETEPATAAEGSALEFEVPEGWVDDDGTFRYYTPEEKAAVRMSMMGEAEPEQPAPQAYQPLQTRQSPYGALQRSSSSFYGNNAASENAARRTPQPAEPAPITYQSQATYDPYAPISRPSSSAPQVAQPALITPAAAAGFVPAPPIIDSFAPVPAVKASSSSYDPYAPAPALYEGPYASSARSMPSSLAPNPPPVTKPAPPQRVASNAYDPPFVLKSKKSFIKPTPPPAAMPAPPVPPPPAFAPPASQSNRAQPTPPPGPPPGPPKRAPSVPPPPVAPPSRPASAFVPPPPVLAIQEDGSPLSHRGEYDAAPSSMLAPPIAAPPAGPPAGPPRGPPSRPPSSASQRKAPAFSSFDPPLRAPPVSRPTSRNAQRPAFEAPHRPPSALRMEVSPLEAEDVSNVSSQPPSQHRAPPPPGRPISRGMESSSPATRAPPPGPPSGPPPGPPSAPPPAPPPGSSHMSASPRAPSRIVPPPPGPPPGSCTPETPTTDDLPRPSGVPSAKGWPHLSGEEDEDADYTENGEQDEDEPPKRSTPSAAVRSVQRDELDPEGGMEDDGTRWDSDDNESYAPLANDGSYDSPVRSVEQEQRSSFGGQGQLSPQSSLGLREDRQEEVGPGSGLYGPTASISAPAPPSGPPRGAPPPGRPPMGNRQPSTAAGYDPYATISEQTAPGSGISPTKSRPPIPAPFMAVGSTADPYAPSNDVGTASQVSDAYTSAIPHPPSQSSYDSPYGPALSQPASSYAPPAPMPIHSDPYARVASPAQTSELGSSAPTTNNYFQSAPGDTSYVPQQVLEQRPISDDPLGRGSTHAKNVPLAVFGFGGVLVTSFPAQASAQEDAHRGKSHSRTPSYGYASVRGKIWIRGVADMASSSAIKADSDLTFPGPLLYDGATKGAAAEKKKKETLLAYLEARADEVERGLPYLKSASATTGIKKRREEEAKVVLLRVLTAMLLDEGKDGRAKYQEALIKALSNAKIQPLITPTATSFAAQTGPYGAHLSSSGKPAAAPSPGQMSTLVDLLSTGNKREAAEYASRQSLWSHALVIASSVGPDIWRDTVKAFTEAELAGEGLGGMKAAYSLFAAAGVPAAGSEQVDELFAAASLTDDPAKDQWKEVIGAIVLNGQPADMAHLDGLGERFSKKGLNNAASICYLLSSTSPFADPSPNAVNKPISILQDVRDEDAIIFAEVAEYARNLLPVPKGQEVPFAGLPRLLPYKLQRAWLAAELGEMELAQRYCQAVEMASKAIKNGPALLSPHHTASLEDLLERLTGSPSIEPAKNLSARKATAKPGFDKLGSWLEGRLTKFIAGDDNDAAPAAKPIPNPKDKSAPVGPFSHFASISPGRSADVSRNPSVPDFGASGSVSSINGLLSAGAPPMGGRASPLGRAGHGGYGYGQEQSQSSPTRTTGTLSGYSPFQPSSALSAEEPQSTDGGDEDVGELLNPMAALSFGVPAGSVTSYAPSVSASARKNEVNLAEADNDDDDDLGFGNAALSCNRTPRPPSGKPDESSPPADKAETETKEPSKEEKGKGKDAEPAKDATQKKGWLSGWFGGKKEDAAGGGPIRAKLGEENAMVFDPELKRWVIKGQKPEAAPAPPPPPPRSSAATPAVPPGASEPPAGTPPTAFNTMPRAGPSSSVPPGGPPAGAPPRSGSAVPPSGGPPGPPSMRPASTAPPSGSATPMPTPGMGGPPKAKGVAPSIDDLLSRPASKRPGSAAARKGAKNRYVDVFQQPQ